MPDNITCEPVSFTSTEKNTTVHGYIWRDESNEEPRGIVHIVHGMAEHIERYEDFARFLVAQGYIACGYDHIGHGRSISDTVSWGSVDPKEGARHLVEDIGLMRDYVAHRTPPGIPYFVFGHSMGSYATRVYIARHGEGLAGAIICGTGHVAPIVSKMGNLLARAIAALRGAGYKSKLLDHLVNGRFNDSVDNPRTSVDWISASEKNVDAYLADEASGFMFSAGGYAMLTTLTKWACSPASYRGIPHELPLLFVAGADDPVGSMGSGVRHTAQAVRKAGVENVEVIIYEGMRHEILNEDEGRLVYADVLAWLQAHDGGDAQ